MAKLTTRDELTAQPADDDLLYLVDVDDTTDDPAGSDKKIKYSNANPDASTTVKGKVELATTLETTTGTDTARATTPAGVKAVADTKANTSHTHTEADVTDLDHDAVKIRGVDVDASVGTPSDGDIMVYRSAGDDFVLEAKPISSGSPEWGDIIGTLSDQTDLQAELDAKADATDVTDHTGNTTDAHNASAISVVPAGTIAATDVQAALEELDTEKATSGHDHDADYEPAGAIATHEADTTNVHGITDTSVLETTTGSQTKVDTHVNDTSDAHDASAISFVPAGNIAATQVQAAIEELDTEKSGTGHTHAGAYSAGGTDVALADGGTGASLTDPDADRMMFWDDSAGAMTWLTPGTGLAITGTTLDATASGGQTLVTHIVAASGGTHTTLGAALAAAAAGDTIYVREGTYTESAITTTLANITIIGENRESTIIDFGSNSFTYSGTRNTFQNLAMTFSTGRINANGTFSQFLDCNLTISGNNYLYVTAATGGKIDRCVIFDTNTSTHSNATISFEGGATRCTFSNNFCSMGVRKGDSSTGWLNIADNNCSVVNNKFLANSVAATSPILSVTGARTVVADNNFNIGASSAVWCSIWIANASNCVIANNTISDGIYGINTNTGCSLINITGNNIRCGGGVGIAISFNGLYSMIVGNMCSSSNTALYLGESGTPLYCVVSGNHLTQATTGLNLGSGVAYGTVTGNTFRSNTTNLTDASVATNIIANDGVPVTQEKRFYRMKNTSGGALAAGDVVILKSVANGDEVTTTTTASDPKVFGMVAEAIADTAYGWVQTLGKTTALKVDGTENISIGDFLTTFTTAKIAKKATAGVADTTPGSTAFAIALEAYTTDNSSGVVDALLIPPRTI